jgi:acyl dehydratase
MSRVLALEQLPQLIGQELALSDWLLVDQARINNFADVSDDHQWIHVDQDRALRENGGTVAHGFLTLALIPHLSDSSLKWQGVSRILNYGLNRVRFTSVVRAGARVRLRQRLVAVEAKGSSMLVTRECTMEIEGEMKPAFIAELLVLIVPYADCGT